MLTVLGYVSETLQVSNVMTLLGEMSPGSSTISFFAQSDATPDKLLRVMPLKKTLYDGGLVKVEGHVYLFKATLYEDICCAVQKN